MKSKPARDIMTLLGVLAGASTLAAVGLMANPAANAAPAAVLTHPIARARVFVDLRAAWPGGVLAIRVEGSRWATGTTLLDGRRGALARGPSGLFGLVPVAIDAEPGVHTLAVFFPGGRRRGGQGSFAVELGASSRPSRDRPVPAADLLTLETAGLRDGRQLLAAIRTRESRVFHQGFLRPPVGVSPGFPFGGFEDFGGSVGPSRDGLSGEHHRGQDYPAPPGTLVRTPGAGIVLLARNLAFSGQTLVVAHGAGLVSVLAHLGTLSVREGDLVVDGAAVGTTSPTGLGAQGLPPHLCFSTYLHAINVDPVPLLDPALFELQR
jgi:hypothetical protein